MEAALPRDQRRSDDGREPEDVHECFDAAFRKTHGSVVAFKRSPPDLSSNLPEVDRLFDGGRPALRILRAGRPPRRPPCARETRSCRDGKLRHVVRGGRAATISPLPVSYTHLRAHETGRNLVCRLL